MSGLCRARSVFAGSVLALCVAASGCSDARQLSAHGKLDVALTEYRIDPQSVRTHPGTLTIVVRNYGRRTHNFVLSSSSHYVGSTAPLWPGQSATIIVTLQPGTYLMASTILSDRSLGEYGTVIVS